MAPPKPKIPPEYANVATKLASESATAFSDELTKLAGDLSGNLESRSTPLAAEGMQSVKAAGIFNKTEGTKTPDVKDMSDFEVGLDELVSGFKEPKAVEGSGVMKKLKSSPSSYFAPDDKTSGVLVGDRAGNYTPDSLMPSNLDLDYRVSDINAAAEANNINNNQNNIEIQNRTTLNQLHGKDKKDYITSMRENIPAVVGGAIGAGVLLSSQNAQARETPLDQELQTDNVATEPKISLTQKVKNTVRDANVTPYSSTGAEAKAPGNSIVQEVSNLADALTNRAKHNLSTFAKDVKREYGEYQAQKDQLAIRATEFINHYEATNNTMMSDDDKELAKDFIGAMEGSPAVVATSAVSAIPDGISKFNQEVLQPLIKTTQGALNKISEPSREIMREHAPSLAALGETVAYPLIGNTGWNLAKGVDTNPDQLDPVVQKLINDKSTLLGSKAGAALMSAASGYKDLPMWLIGGSSKLGLMVGGMANELFVEDSKDSNLTRGALTGLVAGEVMQKGISLLGKVASKVKLSPGGVMDAFGKMTYDSNPEHVMKVWQALMNKNTVEPLLMMTGKTATKMADDAMMKADVAVTDMFKTQKIAPQMLVLDVGQDGPIVYGVKDGLYGMIDHPNTGDRPVMLTQRAKEQFQDNPLLIKKWNELIGEGKKSNPPTRKHGIDEWTPAQIPPENPALVFAWKQAADGDHMMEVYRAGSHEFNADLLKSRALVSVEYDGPNGEPTTGLGFYNPYGSVVFAPDAAEGIPGAIPNDLVFRQTRINPTNPATPPQNLAWEITPITDNDTLYRIIDHVKAQADLTREATAEASRGNMFPDGVPIQRPPNPTEIDTTNGGMAAFAPALAGVAGAMGNNNAAIAATAVAISFLPPAKQAIAKALTKANNAAGRMGLIGDTMYGEKFKIDASIQAFSLRHYKRLTEDLNKQLVDSFRDAAKTPYERAQFNDELRAFIEGNRQAPPPQLIGNIQLKVKKFVAERNYEYALIEQLGGTVPDKATGGNAELERLFALDYFENKEGKINPWIERMRKQQNIPDSLINLLGNKSATKATKNMGHYDQVMGRMSTEMEMADDYMNRKLQINQLGFMKELADNVQASSPVANQMLGHTKQVDFNGSGMLKGKWISEETYKAISTYPQDQKMLQNTMLGVVNMIKFNKTVLNPTTWVKNVMGNVWGVMNSNIVSSWNMAYKMPKGIRQMSKDLKVFNADVMSSSPEAKRVHETLKYGLLGAEFESSRTKMLDILDNLAEPIAQTSNKTWGENLANKYFKAKDATLGGMAHMYSNVDMATKYSLYVNGLERWGIDLGTNKIGRGTQARKQAADLLGATIANNFTITDDALTDMIKREVVRRIHLSLPMVDRIGPVATGLNKLSPITNPWLRTASELTRITMQMPYRMYNEKGYAVNALKTASFLGTILGVNKALRLSEGISDETVDDAKMIAPPNIKNYMPGATATRFHAGEGKDKGIVFLDFANGLVEPAQWFKGGEVSNGVDAAKRVGANGIDLIMGGGLLADESRDAQAALGLTDTAQNFNVPFWKQNDTVRYATQKAVSAGPQIFTNAWQLYSNETMPDRKGVRGADIPRQPTSVMLLKSLGVPAAVMGTEKQREYKLKEISNQIITLTKQKAFAGLQREGSSTGVMQKSYNKEDVKAKLQTEIDRLRIEKEKLEGTNPANRNGSSKLTLDRIRTPHL